MQEYEEIGKLNNTLLSKLNIKLVTNDVVFTFERIKHVNDRRLNLYDQIKNKLPMSIYEPDFIYKDWNNRDNTLVFIKNIEKEFKLNIVIKIAISEDDRHSKNSIITIIKIGEKTFKKIYKNKKENLLYEKLDKNE